MCRSMGQVLSSGRSCLPVTGHTYKGLFRYLFVSLADLMHFRYADIPWRFWGCKDESARIPFLRARISGHIFHWLMEHAEKGSTRNAYVHSLHHWWAPEDAVPLQNNDEFEEAENGHRKKDAVTIASSATYERDLAMAEEKRRASGMPWKVAHLSQDGILGYREVILCPCLHTRHAHRLAVYVLCTQLTQLQKGFVHCNTQDFVEPISAPYFLFRFPEGHRKLSLCLCKMPIPLGATFTSFVSSEATLSTLDQRAQQEGDDSSDEEDEACRMACLAQGVTQLRQAMAAL